MLFIVKRSNGTVRLAKMIKISDNGKTIIHQFDRPLKIKSDDETEIIMDDLSPTLKNYIPKERMNDLRQFIFSGDGSDDFMRWLDSNDVAKYIVEIDLQNDLLFHDAFFNN